MGAREWEKVPEQVTLLSYTVRNLERGKQYKFRVFAENMVGLSEPLNGEPVTAKDPFGERNWKWGERREWHLGQWHSFYWLL